MKKFVCTVCGYVYEAEELPEDYECPLCKVPGSKFKVMDTTKLVAEHEFGVYESTVANNADTVHEMARDEARHGKALQGLLNRYFK